MGLWDTLGNVGLKVGGNLISDNADSDTTLGTIGESVSDLSVSDFTDSLGDTSVSDVISGTRTVQQTVAAASAPAPAPAPTHTVARAAAVSGTAIVAVLVIGLFYFSRE